MEQSTHGPAVHSGHRELRLIRLLIIRDKNYPSCFKPAYERVLFILKSTLVGEVYIESLSMMNSRSPSRGINKPTCDQKFVNFIIGIDINFKLCRSIMNSKEE